MRPASLALVVVAPFVLAACGGAAKSSYRSAPPMQAPASPTYPSYPPPGGGAAGGATGGVDYAADKAPVAAPGAVMVKEESAYVAEADVSGSSGGGTSAPPPPPQTAVEPQANTQEMFDIEARMSVEVEKVSDAAAKVREMTKKRGGQIVADTQNEDSGQTTASFTLRVPSKGSDAFIDELSTVGAVRSRQVTARDISKEYHDAQIYLHNLEAAMKRYEDILQKANGVPEILQIEQQLTRIRAEIDHVKGDLRFMRDRAARSTIYLTLYSPRPEVGPTFNPQAKVYPGLRFAHLADFRGDAGNAGYLGAGLSLAFSRAFSIEVEGYRKLTNPSSGLDLFMISLGGELYSDFLGAGKRTWLNPYVGLRIGYAHFLEKDEMTTAATVGVEIYKSKVFRLDANGRVIGFFGNKDVGGHIAVSPGLAMYVAF